MKSKTRGLLIKRKHLIVKTDKKGNPVEEKANGYFVARINAAIPFDHKLFQPYVGKVQD